MADSIDDLRFFVTLAETSTLTEAARIWGTSTARVSRRLRSIEDRLRIQLVLRRGSRGFELTGEGRTFRDEGRRILDQLEALEDDLSPEDRALSGHLRVVSTVGYGRHVVAPLVRSFREANLGVQVTLELSTLPLSAMVPGFDVAIQVGPVSDSALTLVKLESNRRVLVASPDYLERHGTPRLLADLQNHRCLVIRENGRSSSWPFIVEGRQVQVPIDADLECSDGDVVVDWCLKGTGIAMRSLWHVKDHLDSGDLVAVLPDIATPQADVVALYDADRHIAPRVGIFQGV